MNTLKPPSLQPLGTQKHVTVQENLRTVLRLDFQLLTPTLRSLYCNKNWHFSQLGLGSPGTVATTSCKSLKISSWRGESISDWSRSLKAPWVITVKDMRQKDIDNDYFTMTFPGKASVVKWFKFFKAFANNREEADSRPEGLNVLVSRVVKTALIQTLDSIQREKITTREWVTICGNSQTTQVSPNGFTYVSPETPAFVYIKKKNNNITDQRYLITEKEASTIHRTYCFSSNAEAQGWFNAWEACSFKHETKNGPTRVVYDGEFSEIMIEVVDDALCLRHKNSYLLETPPPFPSDLKKANFTIEVPGKKFTSKTGFLSWIWTRYDATSITILTDITYSSDLHKYLCLEFSDAESCSAWFSYLELKHCGIHDIPAPHPVAVTLIETSTCWMYLNFNTEQVQVLTITGEWTNMFKKCKMYNNNALHVDMMEEGQSFLCYARFRYELEEDLILERRCRGPNDPVFATSRYSFATDQEARWWYTAIKDNIKENLG